MTTHFQVKTIERGGSRLFQKFGYQHHCAAGSAFNLAGGVVGEANVFYQRAALERQRRTLYFEVFDESGRIAFG